MVAENENALICDLAETYHVLDWRALPIKLAATLAAGLRDDARIKLKLSRQKRPADLLLLAAAVDRLSALVWFKTKDGQKGVNRPVSMVEALTGEKTEEYVAFESIEDFNAARKRLMEG